MLLADKEHLERDLKRSLLLLAEKELNFFEQCLNSVGTQAALIAGFASAIIVETASDLMEEAPKGLQVSWIFATSMGMVLEISCVVSAMQLSILAPGLALRGPEGSMSYALSETRAEYGKIVHLFYAGLAFFHLSSLLYVWAMFSWELALTCSVVVAFGLSWLLYRSRKLIDKLSIERRVSKSRRIDLSPQPSCCVPACTTAAPVAAHACCTRDPTPPPRKSLADIGRSDTAELLMNKTNASTYYRNIGTFASKRRNGARKALRTGVVWQTTPAAPAPAERTASGPRSSAGSPLLLGSTRVGVRRRSWPVTGSEPHSWRIRRPMPPTPVAGSDCESKSTAGVGSARCVPIDEHEYTRPSLAAGSGTAGDPTSSNEELDAPSGMAPRSSVASLPPTHPHPDKPEDDEAQDPLQRKLQAVEWFIDKMTAPLRWLESEGIEAASKWIEPPTASPASTPTPRSREGTFKSLVTVHVVETGTGKSFEKVFPGSALLSIVREYAVQTLYGPQGLLPSDLLLFSIDGQPVESERTFSVPIGRFTDGDRLEVAVQRVAG